MGNSKSSMNGGGVAGRPPVVCITGASAGVGRALAIAFARDHHASLALFARSESGLQSCARECEAAGATRTLCIPFDCADSDANHAAAARVEKELGPIDCWINNAMATVLGKVRDLTPRELRRVTDVTYLGSIWGIQAAMKVMQPRNRGLIIQIGSALAHRSIPLQASYCGAKHGLRGFIDSLRPELEDEKSNLNICMVQLPAVNTPQFNWLYNKMPRRAKPASGIFQPEQIADAIVKIAADPKPEREIYLSGSAIMAIMGQKVLPEALDKKLASLVKGQQDDQPEDSKRPNNLFEPIPDSAAEDNKEMRYTSRGRFSGEAASKLWVTGSGATVRGAIFVTGVAVVGAVGFVLGQRYGK